MPHGERNSPEPAGHRVTTTQPAFAMSFTDTSTLARVGVWGGCSERCVLAWRRCAGLGAKVALSGKGFCWTEHERRRGSEVQEDRAQPE